MSARGDRCDAKRKRRRGAFFGRTEEREKWGPLACQVGQRGGEGVGREGGVTWTGTSRAWIRKRKQGAGDRTRASEKKKWIVRNMENEYRYERIRSRV